MSKRPDPVRSNALKTPCFTKMKGKRIVLASASPRRKEILENFGLSPEVIPSKFKEDLPKEAFLNVYEYPVSTAAEKAVEVYRRLVEQDPENPPDLVIAADTIVLTHPTPAVSTTSSALFPVTPELLEKPESKADNLRMLLELNGLACEVVTGVAIVYPVVVAPGYAIHSIDERSLVYFAENPQYLLEAYADCGEGLDRAGGFAVQGLGGHLIKKVDGDFWNVVGFPACAVFKYMDKLLEEDEDFLSVD